MERRNRILIVDDDHGTLAMMQEALQPFYDVLTADSGESALALLKGSAGPSLPDLILLDISMPGMNGYEVLSALEAEEALRKIPVVFLTGLTDEQEELKGLSQNVLDYLKKPVGMRVLLLRLRHYLNLTAARSGAGILDEKKLSALLEPLTGRESDVAGLMAQFRSDREISEMLNISMPYTKKLVGVVKEKMGLEKRGDIRRYLK